MSKKRRTFSNELKFTIIWIPSTVRGIFWFAYVIVDVWSCEIVGWTIHTEESELHGVGSQIILAAPVMNLSH